MSKLLQEPTESKSWVQGFFLIVVPLSIFILFVASVGVLLHRQAIRQLVAEHQERSARLLASIIEAQIVEHQSHLEILVHLHHDDAIYPEHEISYINQLFDSGIGVFNKSSQQMAGESDGIWEDERVHDIVEALWVSSTDHVIRLIPGETPQLLIAVRGVEQIIVGILDPNVLLQEAALIDRPEAQQHPGSILVTDQTGNVLYADNASFAVEKNHLDHPGILAALRGEYGTLSLDLAEGEQIVAFVPLPLVDWGLVIETSWLQTASPLLQTAQLLPAAMLLILAIGLVGMWLGLYQIVYPLQQLSREAEALADGRFDAMIVPVGGSSEIRKLQTKLVQMAQRLQIAQGNLKQYAYSLESGQEDERRRLARELHDDAIQSLIALNQRVQMAQLISQENPLLPELEKIEEMIVAVIGGLRNTIRELRPVYLEDLGLVPALQMLTRDLQEDGGIKIMIAVSGQVQRLRDEHEVALYRIFQEGMRNIIRHAEADTAKLTISFKRDRLIITLVDEGKGFAVHEESVRAMYGGHVGLLGMRERAEKIGAQFEINSEPGENTVIIVKLVYDHSQIADAKLQERVPRA